MLHISKVITEAQNGKLHDFKFVAFFAEKVGLLNIL